MYRSLYYIVLFLLLSGNIFSQTHNIQFDNYGTDHGLSNGYVNCAFKDSQGFMWFGTANGLNRFDGFSFTNYYVDNYDTLSIPGNGVQRIDEDAYGNLWVGTINGVCTYNREKNNYIRKTFKVSDSLSFKEIYTRSMFIDNNGYLWIGSFDGIFRIKLNNETASQSLVDAEHYTLHEPLTEKSHQQFTGNFAQGPDNTVWLTNYSNKLFWFSRDKKSFIPELIDIQNPENLLNKEKRLLIDKDGDFYITVAENGLIIRKNSSNTFSLLSPDNTNLSPKGTVLYAISGDNKGQIWIGDRLSEGISIYNKKTKEFRNIKHDEASISSLISNKINNIYCDNTGTVWVNTIIGISKYSPGKIKFKSYYYSPHAPNKLNYNNILCFEESSNGDIWIGTDGMGINKMNRKTGICKHFVHDPNIKNSPSSNAIISLLEDHKGVLWAGTFNGGLLKYENGNFTSYMPNPNNPYSISNQHIWYVFEDSKENLWIATMNTGISLFDRKTEKFHHYQHQQNKPGSLVDNTMYGIFEDSKQNIYFTSIAGVSSFNLNDYNFDNLPPDIQFKNLTFSSDKNSISSDNIYCINEDFDGNIWFGSLGTGIDKLNPKTGEFTNYSSKEGLPGNSITSILIDNNNKLWLATNNGLAQFDPDNNQVSTYDQTDRLRNSNFKGWAMKASDGEMFFGGPNGFNSFYPEKMGQNKNTHKPPVIITKLKVFNREVGIGEKINNRVILQKDISETQNLTFTHLENFFAFDFIALDYTTPSKNQYAYKLEGFDSEWIYPEKPEANYTNIDPGKYVFKVKASNNDGVWNEEGISLNITILPPWWETLLFKILFGLAIALLAASYFLYRIQKLNKQKQNLRKLVNKKTLELQDMNSKLIKQTQELIATNEILTQRQAEIEEQSEELSAQKSSLQKLNKELSDLNETKDRFFSIIAHDIKSPFNVIIGFSELLCDDFDDLDDSSKKRTISLIHQTSKNLYALLDNLLQWSRSQQGLIDFNPEIITLKDALSHAINVMEPNANEKNIQIQYSLEHNNISAFADKFMLDTILRNLISNAIKFTHNNGQVTIKATTSPNKQFVECTVSDKGIGMDNETLKNIFKLKTRKTSAGTNNEKGTGLGLILVHDFVLQNGGDIHVESQKGKGSSFIFTLPLAK